MSCGKSGLPYWAPWRVGWNAWTWPAPRCGKLNNLIRSFASLPVTFSAS